MTHESLMLTDTILRILTGDEMAYRLKLDINMLSRKPLSGLDFITNMPSSYHW